MVTRVEGVESVWLRARVNGELVHEVSLKRSKSGDRKMFRILLDRHTRSVRCSIYQVFNNCRNLLDVLLPCPDIEPATCP